MILEELALTTAATMATMAVVEIRGRISTTFWVKREKKWLMMNPAAIGTITTLMMERNMLAILTSTLAPAYT